MSAYKPLEPERLLASDERFLSQGYGASGNQSWAQAGPAVLFQ